MKQVYQNISPCRFCTRVREPEKCENKGCKVWQKWFVARWDQLRAYPRLQVDVAKSQPVGVNIGGVCYAAPHQVTAYLQKDPCHSCVCPPGVCQTPCRIRRAWETARNEVMQ